MYLQADVIVICVSPDLDLTKGHTTSAVSRAAGSSLQKECNDKYANGIEEGEVAITRGGKLKCNRVYIITLSQWTSGGGDAIGEAVENVLNEANNAGAKSLTMPPIGSGYLNYNLDVVAYQMFKGVTDFVNKNSSTSIRHVTFVVFTTDDCRPVYEMFYILYVYGLFYYSAQNIKKSVMIGGISVSVIRGKIQEEKKGCVTSALSRAAGKSLQQECNSQYPDGIQQGEVATTRGGKLKCNRVYHVTLPQWTPGGEGNSSTTVTSITMVVLTVEELTPVFEVVQTCTTKMKKGIFDYVKCLALVTEARLISGKIQIQHQKVMYHQNEAQNPYYKDLYKKPLHPPGYWSHYDSSKSLKDWNISRALVKTVSVDQSTYDAVEKLVMDTWKQQFVGHGQDAAGLDQLGVENPHLFEKYANHRADMFRKAGNIGTFKSLESHSNVQEGPVLTTSKCDSILTQDMYPEINEHYLFHGTCVDKVEAILSQGLDFRLAGSAALGSGVYSAESSTKADQYADPVNNRDKVSDKKMLLLRVCLGEICILTQSKVLKRPPCKVCSQDNCTEMDHSKNGIYNSIVTDKIWNFREFVVYDQGMCYPEYVITYDFLSSLRSVITS
ncbi:hypothetical protein KUTeg_024239 [Tegillarca granosa]|uniref:Poly [ADP-ribose] polymerase n=1 Tax=Tegillarca granosa TaxID=220873 RepID=A0ABQ9DWS5_TEGGR|nr:hypothetical protein KUTeg_024239 [Tegillarca granosa]